MEVALGGAVAAGGGPVVAQLADRHLPSIYYIAPPDPSWTPKECAAYLPGEADLPGSDSER